MRNELLRQTADVYARHQAARLMAERIRTAILPNTQRTLSRLLTHFGHEVLTAGNKQRALELLGSGNIDVLLCDIGLPDGNGYEVVSQAKRKLPIKAIAITGFGTEEDIRRSNEAGFDSHLVKPVDLHKLQTVLDEVA